MKLLLVGSVALVTVFGGRQNLCGAGGLTKKSKLVVFGDSLSDGGDGEYFKWKEDMNGVGALIKEQQGEKFDAWYEGFSSLGYNGMRFTDKLTWVEYLAKIFHKSGCRIPQPLNLAIASATASGEASYASWTSMYGGNDEPIKIPAMSAIVDGYLAQKRSSSKDVIFFNIGGNDINNGVYAASAEATKVAALYTAAATYFSTTPLPIVTDAVAAVMAAASQVGMTLDMAQAATYVTEISTLMQEKMAAGESMLEIQEAIEEFITGKATMIAVDMGTAAVEKAVFGIMTEVSKLAREGYTNINVFAPAPLHLTPAAQLSGGAELVENLIDGFRVALAQQVQALNSQIPNAVRFLDFTKKLTDEILDSDVYVAKLPPAETMCFMKVGPTGVEPRLETLSEGCRCDDYAFVDELHPTGRIHHKLARWVFNEITKANV